MGHLSSAHPRYCTHNLNPGLSVWEVKIEKQIQVVRDIRLYAIKNHTPNITYTDVASAT